MQANEVAGLDHLFHALRLLHLRRQAPGAFNGDLGIVADDLHAKPDRRFGNHRTDRAQTDYAQRVVRQFAAGEEFLLVLHQCMKGFVVTLGHVANEIQRRHQITARQQQRRENQLVHRVGIGARRIENGDAASRKLRHGNIIRAGAGAADGAHAAGNGEIVHFLRAHQDRIGRRRIVGDGIALLRQAF